MEQHTKSLNSKTQTKLLCSIFANQRFHLLISSLISIGFIPLDVPSGELQNLFEV
jgi:hypothetical protein